MKINARIRRKAIKRILKRLYKLQKECNPYGFSDCMEYYYKIEYWENKLNKI